MDREQRRSRPKQRARDGVVAREGSFGHRRKESAAESDERISPEYHIQLQPVGILKVKIADQ